MHEAGFRFKDGRTALEATDEEVEAFLVNFLAVMGDFGRQLAAAMQATLKSLVKAIEPFREDMELLLKEEEKRKQ